MSRKSLFGGVALAVVVLGGVAWRFTTKSADAAQLAKTQQSRKSSAAQVGTAIAGPAQIEDGLSLVGTLESPSVVNLSPKQSNQILTVTVREGDAVSVGQILATLDPSIVNAQVLQQQSAVSSARSRLAQTSVTQGSATTGIEVTIQQRQADVKSAQADYDQAVSSKNARLAADQEGVVDATAKVTQAETGVNGAVADLNSANASMQNAKIVAERQANLYNQGYVSLQDLQSAQTQLTVQANLVEVSKQKLASAQAGVNSAKAQLNAVKQTVSVNRKVVDASVTTANARLAQAQAALVAAVSNRSQRQSLKENVSALKSDVNSAQAQLRGAQAQRSDLTLRSPIDGVVTSRNGNPGDLGTPGQPIVTVQYLKWLYVKVAAPVDQSPNVQIGQSVQLSFDAFPGEELRAPVEKINPSADAQSRQFNFLVRLINPGLRFRPGMYARVKIATKKVAATVAVPREAIRNDSVFVLTDQGVLEQRKVKTGLEDTNMVEILSGVEKGEKVVTLSYTPLKDGQKAKEGKK